MATATPLVKLGHCPLPTWPLPHCLLIKLIHCINTGSNIFIFLVVTRIIACKKENSFGKCELVYYSVRNLSFAIFMFNVYLENRYRCRAVVIRNFTAFDLNQYIQLHDNRVTRVQFCKRASSVTKFSKEFSFLQAIILVTTKKIKMFLTRIFVTELARLQN